MKITGDVDIPLYYSFRQTYEILRYVSFNKAVYIFPISATYLR